MGNTYDIGKVVSRIREGGLRKERGEKTEEKEKDANTPSNFAFEKGIGVDTPQFPSLKVLFINVCNNSLEGRTGPLPKEGDACLSQLGPQRCGVEA